MASLAEIIKDPNYVNANAATKKAIFDKYAPQDPSYSNANAATQDAIRIKFGVAQPRAAEPEGIPGPRANLPAWAINNPDLYRTAVATRQVLGPSLEMAGGAIGGILGGGAGLFGGGPVGAAAGGVAGAGLGYGTVKQGLRAVDIAMGLEQPQPLPTEASIAAGNVMRGATEEMGGRMVGPAVGLAARGVAKGIGKVADVVDLPNILAGKIARNMLTVPPQQLSEARAALRAAGLADLPDITAQQALARGGVLAPTTQATLEKAIVKTPAVERRFATETAQEDARKTTLRAVTPDIDAAIEARRVASKPFYEEADKARVAIDAELTDVISRMPEGTLAKAAELAKMEGRPFIMGKAAPAKTTMETSVDWPAMRETPEQLAEITGESLHYIRRALADIAYGPTATTGAGRDMQLAARGLLNDYIKVFEKKVPAYGQARKVYSDLSAPVNQAQVLREMVSVLEKPGGGERIGPFLNVLGRGEQAMLKRAGGKGAPRFESLDEVLTPEQISKVREVARQLETETEIGRQVSAGQQLATELLKDALPQYRLPNIFNVFATTANKFLDTIGAKVGEKTMRALADAAMSAKSYDELLGTLPADERIKVLKAMQDPATWASVGRLAPSVIRGVAAETPEMPTNALAGENASQNFLAQ